MTTLAINGKKVKVSDDFLSMSPEDQARTVDEIAQSMGQAAPKPQGIVPPVAPPPPAEPMTRGPGPTGNISPELYEMGAIGKRFVEGQAKPAPAAPGPSREAIAANYKPTAMGAFFDGVAQGATFGFADEIVGALGGSTDVARAATDAGKRDRPKTQFAGELTGALAVPLPGPQKVATVGKAITEGAKLGAKVGAAYGVGTSDGGVIDRIKGGLEGAVSGAVFGAAAPAVINFGSKAFRKVFKASATRPTLESLRTTKNVAYDAVDKAGETFGPAELRPMVQAAVDDMSEINYLPEADNVTTGMLRKLESVAEKNVTLGQLDKFRQSVWKRYNTSKEEGLLSIVDAIDDLVASRASTSELLDAARLANARYKKAELLELAFQKASDQTAATGSGGNVLNKFRQAVSMIANNPKQAKWFSKTELDTMRAFIEGTTGQNLLRRVGKLAPTGNGLMTALNLGAVAANPAMLAISATASGAKAIADRGTQQGAEKLIGMVSGAKAAPVPFQPRTMGRGLNALAGPLASEYGR